MKVPKQSQGSGWWWGVLAVATVAGLIGVWGVRARTGAGVDPERLWKEAEAEFLNGHYDRAQTALDQIARLRKPTPYDWILKSQMAMVRGQNDEALAALAKVPDDHKMGAQARLLAGQLEIRRNRARKADELFHQAIKISPSLVQAHRELIYMYGVLLRRDALSAEFQALSKLAPMTFDNVFHWCLTRNTVWEPSENTPLLQSFVDNDPDDRWSRLALAENLRQINKRGEAKRVLDSLPESDPDAIVIRVRLALDLGDDRKAEELLAKGPSDHAELARMRGRIALAHRDGPAAVEQFRAAYKADPDHRDGVFGLGQALTLVGDRDAAEPYLKAARDYDALGTLMIRAATEEGRKDPSLVRALGAACEKIHRLPEARAWYQVAIEANPLDAEAQKALFRLNASDPDKPGATAKPISPSGR